MNSVKPKQLLETYVAAADIAQGCASQVKGAAQDRVTISSGPFQGDKSGSHIDLRI